MEKRLSEVKHRSTFYPCTHKLCFDTWIYISIANVWVGGAAVTQSLFIFDPFLAPDLISWDTFSRVAQTTEPVSWVSPPYVCLALPLTNILYIHTQAFGLMFLSAVCLSHSASFCPSHTLLHILPFFLKYMFASHSTRFFLSSIL